MRKGVCQHAAKKVKQALIISSMSEWTKSHCLTLQNGPFLCLIVSSCTVHILLDLGSAFINTSVYLSLICLGLSIHLSSKGEL